jgi:hypothetical protein
VEAALLGNFGACGEFDRITAMPTLQARPGFMPNLMFMCAQTAEFFGDAATAIERYEWFLANAASDPRATSARDGLARCLILQAEASGAGELPPPTDTGRSGSSAVEVVVYNDSPTELRIVLSGPESRIELLGASPTSGEYDLIGPLSCRTDVPMLSLTVAPGEYRVLVEDTSGMVNPFTGTWTLTSGDRFASCFYIVTTFG